MSKSVNDPDSSAALRRALSSLADGEGSTGDASMVFAGWSQDEELRSAWHAHHLIGDVLRSEDLASTSAHDEAFLKSLRGRLALEPIPFSPAPLAQHDEVTKIASTRATPAQIRLASGSSSTQRPAPGWWMASAAVAAGFVAVAGLLVVTRLLSPSSLDLPQLALSQPAGTSQARPSAATESVHTVGLDRYLEAHRSLTHGVVAAGGAEHRVQIVFESK
jgi:sigma-E factor negative regulatory protein RseA